MRFLNGLFWFLLAVVVSIFTYGNWKHVELNLWSGLIADVNLPLLLLVFFLIGFVPMLLWHQAVKWKLKQRLSATERTLAALTVVPSPAPAPAPVLAESPPVAAGDKQPMLSTGDLVDRAETFPAPRPATG